MRMVPHGDSSVSAGNDTAVCGVWIAADPSIMPDLLRMIGNRLIKFAGAIFQEPPLDERGNSPNSANGCTNWGRLERLGAYGRIDRRAGHRYCGATRSDSWRQADRSQSPRRRN